MPPRSTAIAASHLHAHHLPALLLLALVAVPLLWSLAAAVQAALVPSAWAALWTDPQTLPALGMSLWTGLAASALATSASAWLLCASFGRPAWTLLVRLLAPLLALPHVAFAIGLGLLIAPSGWLVRIFSPWATGLDTPPPWPTTQDPWGLGLIAVLVFKEVAFLLWAALAHLQRADVAQRLQQELQLAHTLGYGASAAWWAVAWPQVWPRMTGPTLAVLAYSLTVVDVALVAGPASPPTLAVLAWQWLQDADPCVNALGAAAGWLLAGITVASATLVVLALRWSGWRARWVQGQRGRMQAASANAGLGLLACLYAAVLTALLVGSVMGSWPFPALWPEHWTGEAWQSVARSAGTIRTTLWLGVCSAATALIWSVAWLELAAPRWHTGLRHLLTVPLLLPAVLWVVGLHRLALAWGVDASGCGLWLVHTLAALPYAMLALHGSYTGQDPRLHPIAASLGHGRWSFLWRVKWPLLRSALAASFAVAFAVSVAQYLPTVYVGAGRFGTVTTEAVTLAAGGQRSLVAAYAGLQWLLPALVFGLAAVMGRARRF